jgi:hypothetical protein
MLRLVRHWPTATILIVATLLGSVVAQQALSVTPGDIARGDYFGTTIALNANGSMLVVGAQGRAGTGAVFTYACGGGACNPSSPASVVPTGGAVGEGFGSALSLSPSGGTLAVGSSSRAAYAGIAYVYSCSAISGACSNQRTILGPGKNGDTPYFGCSVAVSGNGVAVAVGAFGVAYKGAVYLYTCTVAVCTLQQQLVPSSVSFSDAFGYGLAWSADSSVLVASARNKAAVFVYSCRGAGSSLCNASSPLALFPPGASSAGRLGISLAVSQNGSTIAIGAPSDGGGVSGIVWVYACSPGGAPCTVASTFNPGSFFAQLGTSVALSSFGDTLVVGAPGYVGNVYVSACTTGVCAPLVTTIPFPEYQCCSGSSVAIAADNKYFIAMGATNPGASNGFVEYGRAYTYPSASASPSASFTASQSPTISFSSSQSPSASLSSSMTASQSSSESQSASVTPSSSPSGSPSQTQSSSASKSASQSATVTRTRTSTRSQQWTVSQSRSPSATRTPSQTQTVSRTCSVTRTASATPSVTGSDTQTSSQSPSVSGTSSRTSSPTASATQTPSQSLSHTPSATGTQSLTISTTGSGSPSQSATSSQSPTPSTSREPYALLFGSATSGSVTAAQLLTPLTLATVSDSAPPTRVSLWLSRCPDGGAAQIARCFAACSATSSQQPVVLYSDVVSVALADEPCDTSANLPALLPFSVSFGAAFSLSSGSTPSTGELTCRVFEGGPNGRSLARAVSGWRLAQP